MHKLLAPCLFAASTLGLYGCAAKAPMPETPAPAAAPVPVFSAARYAELVQMLSDDRLEGRAPATKGEERTVAVLEDQFKRLGLSPGNGESFLQAVPMVEISPDRREMTLAISGAKGQRRFAYGTEFVAGSRMLQSEISVQDAPLIFAGYGVDAPEHDWNDFAGIDVKDKLIIVLINDPGFGAADPKLFKGPAMTYYGRWTYKFEEAAKKGAAGVLIVHDTKGAAYGWEVVQTGWQKPLYDLESAAAPAPQTKIQGWLTTEAAVALFADQGLDFAALKAAADVRGFKARELAATASITIKNTFRRASSSNVIARLVGTKRPDEHVIYMAHWDHLGRNFAAGQDQILNGAIDNASGVAAVLEVARAFAQGPRPERSVLFFLPTLEESGLLGSRYYAEHPIYPLNKTVAGVNMDALTIIGPTKDVVVTGFGSSELEPILSKYAAAQDRIVVAEPTPQDGFFYRSDHFSFAKVGVPVLYAESGVDQREKGREYGLAKGVDYVANRYHKPSDEFDPSWDLRGVMEDLVLFYQVGFDVANSQAWPAWYADSEFRAIRGRSLAN